MANPKQSEEVIIRLQSDVYRQLEQSMPTPAVTTQTTELQAGFALGIQYVLKHLREGFTVQR